MNIIIFYTMSNIEKQIKLKFFYKDNFYITNIIIENKSFFNNDYYQISFIHETFNEKLEIREYVKNELVYKNIISENIIDNIFKNENELAKITGNTTPMDYKRRLLIILCELFE